MRRYSRKPLPLRETTKTVYLGSFGIKKVRQAEYLRTNHDIVSYLLDICAGLAAISHVMDQPAITRDKRFKLWHLHRGRLRGEGWKCKPLTVLGRPASRGVSNLLISLLSSVAECRDMAVQRTCDTWKIRDAIFYPSLSTSYHAPTSSALSLSALRGIAISSIQEGIDM